MSEEYLVRNCAPTLAGIKTASLFCCPYDSPQALRSFIRTMNEKLNPKGLRILPLRVSEKRALIYLYRPGRLSEDLSNCLTCELLSREGYDPSCCRKCIARLIERIKDDGDFPHEIGLFLGYPPEDVHGFIENKAQNFKCRGLWKVYGDAEAAKKKFQLYKKCDRLYYQHWSKGKDIERLTVAG